MALEATVVPKEHMPVVETLARPLKQSGGPGWGSLTLLVGPKGGGQGRIVEAVLHRVASPDLNVHRVLLGENDERRPFFPVTSLVRRASERSRKASPSYSLFLTPFLPPAPGTAQGRSGTPERSRPLPTPAPDASEPSISSHQRLMDDLEFYKRGVEAWGDRTRFIHEVGESIVELARAEPTLWLLEGAQFLDAHSWSVLRYLAEKFDECPLTIWATFEVDEGEPLPAPAQALLSIKEVRRLDVPTLSREGVEGWLSRWVPRATLSPQFVDIVQKVSQGRAVYVEEIARGQRPAGGTGLTFQVGKATAEGLALDRAERLPTPARELLTRLSFLGRSFPASMASHVGEVPAPVLAKGLSDLVREGFLQSQPGGAYSFVVPSLVDQLHKTVPVSEQHRLHLRVAEALEATSSSQREETLLLADHWWDAGEWEKAAEANLRAAQFALRAYAPDAALGYVKRAREAANRAGSDGGLDLTAALVEEGQALYDLGRLSASKKALDAALKRIGRSPQDWPLRARALFLLARTQGGLGHGEETFPLIDEAKEALSLVHDLRGQLMLHQVVGVSLMMKGENADAATHFRAMLALADELQDPRERSYAQKNLSAVLLNQDPHSEEGMSLVNDALDYHTRTENFAGLAAGYFNRSLTELQLERTDEALADLDRSRVAAERAHAPLLVSGAVIVEAGVLLEKGEGGKAARVLRKLEPWLGTIESPTERADYLILLGRTMEADDRMTEANRAYLRALDEAGTDEETPQLWEAHLRLAALARAQGRTSEAGAHRKAVPSLSQIEKAGQTSIAALLKEYDAGRKG